MVLIRENNQLIWKFVEIINTAGENNQKTSYFVAERKPGFS